MTDSSGRACRHRAVCVMRVCMSRPVCGHACNTKKSFLLVARNAAHCENEFVTNNDSEDYDDDNDYYNIRPS